MTNLTDLTNEGLANRLAADLARFRQRMDAAIHTIPRAYKSDFTPRTACRLNTEQRRLYSANGALYLQWTVRKDPNSPPGPDNPQFAGGYVRLYKTKGGAI